MCCVVFLSSFSTVETTANNKVLRLSLSEQSSALLGQWHFQVEGMSPIYSQNYIIEKFLPFFFPAVHLWHNKETTLKHV